MSDCIKETAPGGFHRQGPDAPSAWLSLVELRPRGARLRFTKQHNSSLEGTTRQTVIGHPSHASKILHRKFHNSQASQTRIGEEPFGSFGDASCAAFD